MWTKYYVSLTHMEFPYLVRIYNTYYYDVVIANIEVTFMFHLVQFFLNSFSYLTSNEDKIALRKLDIMWIQPLISNILNKKSNSVHKAFRIYVGFEKGRTSRCDVDSLP